MLYIFHGPDGFSRSEKIAALKADMGDPTTADLNITHLQGRNLTLSDIQHQADAAPFLGSRRLVIVTDFASGRKKAELQPLLDYLENFAPTTDLVLVQSETLRKNHPLLKIAGATVQHFDVPAQKTLSRWIMQRTRDHHQAEIEPDAADMLGRLVGPNLRVLNSELEKLSMYTKRQRPIDKFDIELLVPYHEEAENFGLSNAIGQRNAKRALDQAHKLLEEGSHPLAILGSITAQIRALLEVKDMAEQGMNARAIAQFKGWRSDFAAKARLREAANFSMARLEDTLEQLLETDIAIKTGQLDAFLALDILIGQLCGGRRRRR